MISRLLTKTIVLSYREWHGQCDEDAGQTHATQPQQVQRPPAHAVHQRQRHQRHSNHRRANAGSRVCWYRLAQTDAFEDVERVEEDLKNGGYFLLKIHLF